MITVCAVCRMKKFCVCGKTLHERHRLDGIGFKRNCDDCMEDHHGQKALQTQTQTPARMNDKSAFWSWIAPPVTAPPAGAHDVNGNPINLFPAGIGWQPVPFYFPEGATACPE